MNKETKQKTIEEAKRKIQEAIEYLQNKQLDLEDEINYKEKQRNDIDDEIEDLKEQLEEIEDDIERKHEELAETELDDIIPAELQTIGQINGQLDRGDIQKQIREWERVTGIRTEFVDTKREYWQNNTDTIVIKAEVKENERERAKVALEMLGKILQADEIGTKETASGKIIARYWWD